MGKASKCKVRQQHNKWSSYDNIHNSLHNLSTHKHNRFSAGMSVVVWAARTNHRSCMHQQTNLSIWELYQSAWCWPLCPLGRKCQSQGSNLQLKLNLQHWDNTSLWVHWSRQSDNTLQVCQLSTPVWILYFVVWNPVHEIWSIMRGFEFYHSTLFLYNWTLPISCLCKQ